MSWSMNIGGHSAGTTTEQQKAVEAQVLEVLRDTHKKLAAIEGHEYSAPPVWTQHHGQVYLGEPELPEVEAEETEGSED